MHISAGRVTTWDSPGRVAGARRDDVEDLGGSSSTDAEVSLLSDHLGEGLVEGGPCLRCLLLES